MSRIALRYARALCIAAGDGTHLAAISRDLQTLAHALTADPTLIAFFDNPTIPQSSKEKILDDLAQDLGKETAGTLKLLAEEHAVAHISEVADTFADMAATVNTLKLLASERAFGELSAVAAVFARMAAERSGMVISCVQASTALSPEDKERFIAALHQNTGKHVEISTAENPHLICGTRVILGDTVIDSSLQGRLHELEKVLRG